MFISNRLKRFYESITITGWTRKTHWVCMRKFAQEQTCRWYGE